MTLGSNVSPRGFAQRLTENGAANQHPSARYFPQAATSQPRAPYRGHGGLAQQPRLGYVASVATRANNAMVCFCRILLQKSAAVDWAVVPFPRRERRLCRTGPDAFTQLRCYAMRMRHVSRAAASGAKRPFQMLAALGWPKTVSVVRKAPWMLLVGSTKRTLRTSKPRSKLSRKGRGPKSHIGRRRRLGWKQRCDGREEGENAAETLLFEMCFACKAVTAEE